jgi:hypothetical protein
MTKQQPQGRARAGGPAGGQAGRQGSCTAAEAPRVAAFGNVVLCHPVMWLATIGVCVIIVCRNVSNCSPPAFGCEVTAASHVAAKCDYTPKCGTCTRIVEPCDYHNEKTSASKYTKERRRRGAMHLRVAQVRHTRLIRPTVTHATREGQILKNDRERGEEFRLVDLCDFCA